MAAHLLCFALALVALRAQAAITSYQVQSVSEPVIMGESPYYDSHTDTVIFVDIEGKQVLRYDPKSREMKNISFADEESTVSPAVPVKGTNLLLVGVGCTLNLVEVNWGAPGKPAVIKSKKALAQVHKDRPRNRFNDGKADKAGALWIGTMDDANTNKAHGAGGDKKGGLFRFELHQSPKRGYYVETRLISLGLEIPNGMVWTPDGRFFYVADSVYRSIYRFAVSEDGKTISKGQNVFSFEKHNVTGAPDGMTIDEDGNLWIACVHGWAIIQVDPRTDKLLRTIKMAVAAVSAPEWGGPNRDILYVATSRYQLNATELQQQPMAGTLFQIFGLGTRGYSQLPYPVQSIGSSSQG